MSLRPSKREESNYFYYISDSTPSSKSIPIDHRAPFACGLPSRALVPKSKGMTFVPTQRPKLTSYPSESAGACRDQQPKLAPRTSQSASAHSESMAAQSGSSSPSLRRMPAEHHPRKGQSEEDDDDGSIIVVKVPMQNITSANPSNADLSKLSTGQLIKTVSKALSVDNLRDTYGQGYVQEKRCSTGTELKGLMEVMRLESLLLLLKKYLNLYHDFDESSGDIFIRSTHEEFFTNINQIIVDIAEIARPLGTWSFHRNRKTHPQATQIQKTLRAAYQIRETWIEFFDWKLDVFDPMVRFQQEEEGRVRRGTWEWRRRRGWEVVGGLVGLLANVEMEGGREGILDMQMGLRRRWREDGAVGGREAERRGWVFGVGV